MSTTTTTSVLDTIVSLQAHATATTASPLTLRDFLDKIRRGDYMSQVRTVRRLKSETEEARNISAEAEAKKKDAWEQAKRGLPGVMLSVNTRSRAKGSTEPRIPTGLLQIDLDHVADRAAELKAKLCAMPCMVAVWTSPSGDGLKAVARVEGAGEESRHLRAFDALNAELKREIGMENDKVQDLVRLCFASYDPAIWTREGEPQVLPLPPEQEVVIPDGVPADIDQPVPVQNQKTEANQPHGTDAERDRIIMAKLATFPCVRHQGLNGSGQAMRVARALWTGFALGEDECMRFMREWSRRHASPPWTDQELRHKLDSVKSKPHLMPHGCLWKNPGLDIPDPWEVLSAMDLMGKHPEYNPPLIDGLLREQETLNIIAAPKIGKSFLVLNLALSVANGRPFFGRTTARVPVLIVDNELHPATLAQRLKGVCEESMLSPEGIHVVSLRGQVQDLEASREQVIRAAKACGAKVIIMDALYRFLSKGVSENDNADMTHLFNMLNRITEECGAAIVCIHHSSKGNQGEKSVTDGGAGAGAIARAADAHLFLREHEESPSNNGCDEQWVSVQYAVRSWPPGAGWVIGKSAKSMWWRQIEGADPEKVKGRKAPPGKWTFEEVLAYIPETPATVAEIAAAIERDGKSIPDRKLRDRLNGLAERKKDGIPVVYRSTGTSGAALYSTGDPAGSSNINDRIMDLLRVQPTMSTPEIIAQIGCSRKTVDRARTRLLLEVQSIVEEDNPK